MMMNELKKFYTGSLFLGAGLFTLTLAPVLCQKLDLKLILNSSDYVIFAFILFMAGTVFYTLSYTHYKKQLAWIGILFVYSMFFQLMYKSFFF
jgi:uncharacterized membrane protein